MLLNKNTVQRISNHQINYEVTSSFKISNWHQLATHQYLLGAQQHPQKEGFQNDNIGLLYSYLRIYDGTRTIDFSDQKAVISLTRCILKVVFDIQWTLPLQNLCPRIPNRLNYLIWIYRYVIKSAISQNLKTQSKNIIGVDIGTGASLIYPLIGQKMFNWKFIATQIDQKSIDHAEKLVKVNRLQDSIEIRKSEIYLLKGAIKKSQRINFVMCNPPFFDTSNPDKDPLSKMTQNEHNIEGGEYEFFFSLYTQSFHYPSIGYFTMMIGLGRNFEEIRKFLKEEEEEYGLLEEVRFGKINQSQNSRFIVGWKIKHTETYLT